MARPLALRGRQQVVEQIVRTWTGSAPRVLTLTGLPGVGKSRVARHVADRDDFVDGDRVVWVDVVGLDEGDDVLTAVALRARIADSAGLIAGEDAAHGDQAAPPGGGVPVVVIDGDCAATAEVLAEFVDRSPTSRFVVTSRRPLRIAGEHIVRIEPLRRGAGPGSAAELAADPAVGIFLDVAAANGMDLSGAGDIVEIDRICRQLGGLPLAIELAASRAVALTPAEIGRRLEDAMARQSLVETAAAFDELLAAIEWTESLLPPGHADVLDALGVFRTGVPLDAVEMVSGSPDVVDALSDLVDVHLVDVDRSRSVTAYSLPPIVGEHARGRLGGVGSERARSLAAAHTAWAVDAAASALPGACAEVGVGDGRLTEIEPDLVVALRHAAAAGDGSTAVQLMAALAAGWMHHDVRDDHIQLATLACDASVASDDRDAQTIALGWRANLRAERVRFAADLDAVAEDRARSLELVEGAGPLVILRVTALAVRTARVVSDPSELVGLCADGLALATELGDQPSMARFEIWLAMIVHQGGDADAAARWAGAALDRARMLGDESLMVASAAVLRTLPEGTPIETLVPSAVEIVEAARRCGDRRTMTWMLGAAALELLEAGDPVASAVYLHESLEIVRGSPTWVWHAVIPLAILGVMAQMGGDDPRAGRLHGAISPQLEAFRSSMPAKFVSRVEQSEAALRERMGAAAFEAAAGAGSLLTFDEAVTEAILDARERMGLPADPEGAVAPESDTKLTPRENEVLARLAVGDSYKDVAGHLGIRPKTVMHHASNLYRKLGVRGRGEAVAWHFRGALPSSDVVRPDAG